MAATPAVAVLLIAVSPHARRVSDLVSRIGRTDPQPFHRAAAANPTTTCRWPAGRRPRRIAATTWIGPGQTHQFSCLLQVLHRPARDRIANQDEVAHRPHARAERVVQGAVDAGRGGLRGEPDQERARIRVQVRHPMAVSPAERDEPSRPAGSAGASASWPHGPRIVSLKATCSMPGVDDRDWAALAGAAVADHGRDSPGGRSKSAWSSAATSPWNPTSRRA